MNKVKGFAMSGTIGAGKTTVCNKIMAAGQGRIVKVSFAGPLKTLAAQLLGREIDKATDRPLLVAIGMGMRSDELRKAGYDALVAFLLDSKPVLAPSADPYLDFNAVLHNYCATSTWGHKNHWIEQLTKQVEQLSTEGVEAFVIEDMRFLNEYHASHAIGLTSLRVQCNEDVRIARLLDRDGKYNALAEQDPSEQEWPLIPVDVLLDTTKEENVDEEVKRLVEGLFS